MKYPFLLMLFLALVALPLRAQAVFDDLSSAQLENVFKSEGYSYTVDSDGDIIWKLEGVDALVLRQAEGRCLSFRVAFKNEGTTLSKVNEWNMTRLYGRSYLDNDGDPVLQADLDLVGGVTDARIKDFLHTCRSLFLAWRKDVL